MLLFRSSGAFGYWNQRKCAHADKDKLGVGIYLFPAHAGILGAPLFQAQLLARALKSMGRSKPPRPGAQSLSLNLLPPDPSPPLFPRHGKEGHGPQDGDRPAEPLTPTGVGPGPKWENSLSRGFLALCCCTQPTPEFWSGKGNPVREASLQGGHSQESNACIASK